MVMGDRTVRDAGNNSNGNPARKSIFDKEDTSQRKEDDPDWPGLRQQLDERFYPFKSFDYSRMARIGRGTASPARILAVSDASTFPPFTPSGVDLTPSSPVYIACLTNLSPSLPSIRYPTLRGSEMAS